MTKKRRILLLLAVFVLVAAALAAYAGARALLASDSGGVSAGVSSLAGLPAPVGLPPDVERWLDDSARAVGTDPAEAKRSVRKLRSNLGEAKSDLYAYLAASGATCFYLRNQVALCPQRASAGRRGIQWVTGGGYGAIPRNVVGVVADDVVEVSLVSEIGTQEIPIENNAIFADLPRGANQLGLSLTFRDGTVTNVNLPAAGG